MMLRADVESYVRRDWHAVEAAKGAFWAEQKRRLTARELFMIVDAFRAEIRSARPNWPSSEDRADDLESHRRLGEQLRRVRAHTSR